MNYNACNGIVYVIKPGDTLYKISQHYGIPTAKILRANPYLEIYNLQIGDKICIPTGGTTQMGNRAYYKVMDGESIKTVLDKTKMSYAEFLLLNPLGTLILKPGLEVVVRKMPRERDTDE